MLYSLADPAAAAEFCALCEVEVAAWRCEECTLPFCDGCREETHSKGDSYSSPSTSQPAGSFYAARCSRLFFRSEQGTRIRRVTLCRSLAMARR